MAKKKHTTAAAKPVLPRPPAPRLPVLISVFLALATFAAYVGVARNDFVNYDDPDYVSSNIHVQTGLKPANLVWAFTTGHASNWHPLTWVSHMLDCQLFGERAAPQHLVNVAFHVANTVLLFLLFRCLTGSLWRSAMVAALFALHPLHVESVAWISERKDVLSALLFLLTLCAYAAYAQPAAVDAPRGPRRISPAVWYGLALVCFVLGLLSKPMLVTMPFVLLLLDYWPLQRLAFPSLRNSAGFPGRLLLEKLPFIALSLASCVVTFIVQRQGGAVSTSISFGGRVANALVSYVRYIGKTAWPLNLGVLYPHPGFWPAGQVVAAGAALLVACGLVVWFGRTRPYLMVGWFWFLGTLVPVIGLVQVGIQAMADRYTYIPLIGLFVAAVWGLREWLAAWPPRAVGVAAALVLIACFALTVRQVAFWKNSETLFQRAVQVSPRNYLAYNNLGFYYSKHDLPAAAITNYEKSLEINPFYQDALNNMGYALAGMKRYPEAITFYERALAVRTDNVEVHNNLGNALSELGRLNEAIEQYSIALKLNPEHADAHNNLGIALAMEGKLDEAIPQFRQAIRYKPGYASAHSNLGNALAAQHKLAEAIDEYKECLRLNPDDPQAHNNLGNALAEQGNLDEAVAQYSRALELNANNPEAHFNLGLALARQGKRALAEAHYAEALRLKPDYAQARQQLELLKSPRPQ